MSKRKIKVGDTVTVVQEYAVRPVIEGKQATVISIAPDDGRPLHLDYPYRVRVADHWSAERGEGVLVHKVKRVKKTKVACPIVGCDKTHPHLHPSGATRVNTTVNSPQIKVLAAADWVTFPATVDTHAHWAGCYIEDVKS